MGKSNPDIAECREELLRMEALLAEYEAGLQAAFSQDGVRTDVMPAMVADVKATVARLRLIIAELTKANV